MDGVQQHEFRLEGIDHGNHQKHQGQDKDKTPPDPNALRVEVQPDDNRSEKLAAMATDWRIHAATMHSAGAGEALGVTELLAAMRKAGDETVAGDMGRFERVLTHQF